MAVTAGTRVRRLARFSLTTAYATGLADAYAEAFGCTYLAGVRMEGAEFESTMGVRGGADCIRLRLGDEIIELLQFDLPGRAYPHASSSWDLVFQHFAIVVSDMAAAHRRLCSVGGWEAITRDGPQHLPAASGGITAFKFRDPEGHPLELLAFPHEQTPTAWRDKPGDRLFLGIDHSAIAASDTGASIAFYRALGLGVTARSLNQGPEQARLDGLAEATVEVSALSPPVIDPHVELLCYRNGPAQTPPRLQMNDIAATRLVFESDAAESTTSLIDPDGHHLIITPA